MKSTMLTERLLLQPLAPFWGLFFGRSAPGAMGPPLLRSIPKGALISRYRARHPACRRCATAAKNQQQQRPTACTADGPFAACSTDRRTLNVCQPYSSKRNANESGTNALACCLPRRNRGRYPLTAQRDSTAHFDAGAAGVATPAAAAPPSSSVHC